jgi:hypothetical protein
MTRRWLDPAFFTDEKIAKRATVPERLLAAAMIANQDDDGRLRGDPAYLRSIAFMYDDYSLEEVKVMRDHLGQINPNIIIYQNGEDDYIQLKRYRRYQKPRYYHPSKFPPPPGWPFEQDGNHAVTTQLLSGDHAVTEQQPRDRDRVGMGLDLDKDLDLDKGKGGGQPPSPSPTSSTSFLDIHKKLTSCFTRGWGAVKADNLNTVIPRKPTAKEAAQLRDLAEELLAAGGCPLDYIEQAFKEATDCNKQHISYVRAILFDWLGRERPPPK